ncbi:MAG: LacI family DNA-binding transcriptional regulator [Actinomycetes bacterium]
MSDSPRKTLQDVAEAAGLSKAATSYALRGIRVSEETGVRVRAIAAELGYSVDPIARALASGRSGNIGIVGALQDRWRQGLAVMMSQALRERELSSLIADVGASPVREQEALLALTSQRVDGALVLPVDPSAQYWAELPAALRVVSIGDALTQRPDSGSVLFDNEYGVGTALRHLAELGHRDVGFVAPALPTTPGRPVEVLAQELGASMGVKVQMAYSSSTVTAAERAAHALLSAEQRPTALFCLSDAIAFGALSAARALSLAVPAELSILGFDDNELAPLVHPGLTTFGWDEQAIVDAAVLSLTEPASGDRVVFRPVFIERGSTAVAPGGRAPSRRPAHR